MWDTGDGREWVRQVRTYSFQVMNFEAGVVSIKIAVLRRELGEMKNLMVATITPGVISI